MLYLRSLRCISVNQNTALDLDLQRVGVEERHWIGWHSSGELTKEFAAPPATVHEDSDKTQVKGVVVE